MLNFKITNFHCDACVTLAKKTLEKISGVTSLEISPDGDVKIEAEREITADEIKQSLEKIDQKAKF